MLYAYRGIGKTYIALGIAAAVSSGGLFLRWAAPTSITCPPFAAAEARTTGRIGRLSRNGHLDCAAVGNPSFSFITLERTKRSVAPRGVRTY